MRSSYVAAFFLTILLAQGCATARPAPLDPAPAAHAAREVREAYAAANRAVGPLTVSDVRLTGLGLPVSSTTTFLQLEDGRRIDDPAQILPAVDDTSVAAAAAKKSIAATERANLYAGIGGTINGIALGGSVAGLALLVGAQQDAAPSGLVLGAFVTTLASLGALLVGTAILVPAEEAAHEARMESATAFATYNTSLRQRLDLPDAGIAQAARPTSEAISASNVE